MIHLTLVCCGVVAALLSAPKLLRAMQLKLKLELELEMHSLTGKY